MDRVVILGPGGAGKSVLARRLGAATGIPVVELDACFWSADLTPTPAEEWADLQAELFAADGRWIADGDLGPYDQLEVRLTAADTVILLDYPTWLCAWRAARRSRNNWEFWRWLFTWRRVYRPRLVARLRDPIVLRSPKETERYLTGVGDRGSPPPDRA